MRARDPVAPFPTVRSDASAWQAARPLPGSDVPGLIVVDHRGRPTTVLAGTQVPRTAIPSYCVGDTTLARVFADERADRLITDVAGRTVEQRRPEKRGEPPMVDPDTVVLEIAALTAQTRGPLSVGVATGEILGAITRDALLDRMLVA